jgi:nucleotide-binding universal stress UspA family protein
MSSKRRSFEKGHKRKYLVVVDDTEECSRAVHWATKRAGRTKSIVMMLRVIETGDHDAQWLGVADIMRVEAMDAAKAMLNKAAEQAKKAAPVKVEMVIREGTITEEIVNLIEEDADIGILVLAASTGKEGPGPLVSHLAKNAGNFPIPVAIVPGHLSDDEIDASS